MTLLPQIRQTLNRHRMLPPGTRLGIAVSGGADSVCLLHILLDLRQELDLQLSVIHINHNLRGPASQADARFVHNLAQQHNLPFHPRTLDLDLTRGNLEQDARRARLAIFHELIRDGTVQKVALGHTRTDQAETVLYRLLRGAGSAGLAGIRPVTDSGIIRPLLQVTRPQVVEWLTERNIAWREDATNSDLRFDRNRLRHQLIPALETEWNPGLQAILAQTADWALEEEQYWRDEIPRLTADWLRFVGGAAILDAGRLNVLPVAVVRRVIRATISQVKGDLLGVDFAHVEAVRRLALSPQGEGCVQVRGLEVVRSFDWLRFAKPDKPHRDWEIPVTTSGRFPHPGGEHTFVDFSLKPQNDVYNRDVNALDLDKTGDLARASLVLRNWRPGDKYQRVVHSDIENIQKLFQQHRIPSWDRQNWPVVTVGGSIAWAREFGSASAFAADADSRTVLVIRSL